MGAIHIENFEGTIPKLAPTALSQSQAQRADNCRLYGQDINPWRKIKLIYKAAYPVAQPIKTIYHLTSGVSERWLTWLYDTDVIEGPVPDVTENRLYYTNAAEGARKTNWAMASSGAGPYPTSSLPMGITYPTVAPTLVANGAGTGTAVTRAYVYTWVNMFGAITEESSPSPPNSVNWLSGQSITVSGFQAAPGAPYNFTKIRIYRTVVGSTPGVVNYLMVAEIPIGTGSYVDAVPDYALPGDPLSTDGFDPPPTNMIGLTLLPNGICAGFFENTVCFAEPYKPYAWPAIYQQPLGYKIVGMGVYEQNLVVMTTECPYILTGVHPSQMTVTRVSLWEPCVAKRSIASDLSGVTYASPNGLVGVSALVQGVISNGLMRRTDWTKVNPTDFTSTIYNNQYFGWHADTIGDSSTGGWAEIFDKSESAQLAASSRADVASYSDGPPKTRMDYWVNAAFVDRQTAGMYVVNHRDNQIYQIDGDQFDSMIATWHSKRFVLPQPANMAAIQVDADYFLTDVPLLALVQRYVADNTAYITAHPASNFKGGLNEIQVNGGGQRQAIGNTMGTVNGSPLLWDVPSTFDFANLNVRVYASDTLVFTYNPRNLEPQRMLGGFKSRTWEVEITSNFRVRSVSFASSMQELKQV